MPLRCWIAGLLIAAASLGPAAARDSNNVEAVEPGAAGVLTKCRDWLVATSCKTYHHIELPSRIAVGDAISLNFGSSPKEYRFPVARIALKGNHCAIFSQAHGDRHRIDKINVSPCYRADQGR